MFETHCIAGDTAHYVASRTDTAARQCHDDCVLWVSSTTTAQDPAARPAMGTQTALPLNLLDREGAPITLAQWTRLRRVVPTWRFSGPGSIW